MEDGLSLRYFSIDELLYELKQINSDSFDIFNQIVAKAKIYANKSSSFRTIQEYSQVFRKRLTSRLTDLLINDVVVAEVTDGKFIKEHGIVSGLYELQLNKYNTLCNCLKKAVFKCSTRDENVTLYENRGEVVLRGLFEVLSDTSINVKSKLLPPDYRDTQSYPLWKGCIDYLAGMMDTFAISEYKKFFQEDFKDIKLTEKSILTKEKHDFLYFLNHH